MVESEFVTPTRTHLLLFRAALVCSLVGLGSVSAQAERILLKNGRVILADSVREAGGRVEYTIGDNTFAIPKSSVVSIDTGGTPNVTRREDLPEPPVVPKDEAMGPEAELTARVVVNNRVDQAAITAIEMEGSSEKSAAANFLAAKHRSEERRVGKECRL